MAADENPASIVRPRHEILGVEPGMPGYRRGCRCGACRKGNSDRMRSWRQKRDAAANPDKYVEVPTVREFQASTLIRIDALPPGKVSQALEEDLPRADGAHPFEGTIKAMMRKSALVLDNADAIDRLDLINPMMLRILNGVNVLNPRIAAGGGEPDLVDDLKNLFAPPQQS